MTRCAAPSRYSVAQRRLVALGDAQVVLVADALLGEAHLELVEHHVDLAVDEQVGQRDGRVRGRVLDDPLGERMARAVERVAAHPLAEVGAERGEVVVGPDRCGEVVVELRQAPLAQLAERRP